MASSPCSMCGPRVAVEGTPSRKSWNCSARWRVPQVKVGIVLPPCMTAPPWCAFLVPAPPALTWLSDSTLGRLKLDPHLASESEGVSPEAARSSDMLQLR